MTVYVESRRGSPWIISAVADVGLDREFEVGEIIRVDYGAEEKLFIEATGIQNIRAVKGWPVWKLEKLLTTATSDNPKAFPRGTDMFNRVQAAKRQVEEFSLCRVKVS